MATIVLSPHTLAKDRSDIKAEVTSSNTVGYQKLTMVPGYTMLPNSFVEVGTEDLIPIADMFPDAENATANRLMGSADRIDTWDPIAQMYVSYYRMTNRQGTSVWWGKEGAGEMTDDTFAEYGQGAFYFSQASDDITLTTYGQVKSTDTDIVIMPGFNLICNPYPADLSISGEGIDWSKATANRLMGSADRIDTWDADQQIYVSYYRMTNRQGTSVWWGKEGAGDPTVDTIPAGQAFFYFSQSSASWSLTLPSPVAAE